MVLECSFPRKRQFGGEVTVSDGGFPRKRQFGGELGAGTKNVHRVGLVDIIYVWNSVTCFRDSGERLEQFLLADCGDEFLEIERFEVRNVFESFFFICPMNDS